MIKILKKFQTGLQSRRVVLKTGLILSGMAALIFIGFQPAILGALGTSNNQDDYVLIGWNELGCTASARHSAKWPFFHPLIT